MCIFFIQVTFFYKTGSKKNVSQKISHIEMQVFENLVEEFLIIICR